MSIISFLFSNSSLNVLTGMYKQLQLNDIHNHSKRNKTRPLFGRKIAKKK